MEGSHFWYRFKAWVDDSDLAKCLTNIELERVGTRILFNPWSEEFECRFVKPANRGWLAGYFCRPGMLVLIQFINYTYDIIFFELVYTFFVCFYY